MTTGLHKVRALLVSLALALATVTPAAVTFENAWIRPPAPGQSVAAGYCDIVNQGTETVLISRFVGPLPVELHETTHQDGMARMRALAELPIDGNSTVSLRPGGKHLMLFGLDSGLEQLTLRAVFDNGEEMDVVFAVGSLTGEVRP